MSAVNSACQNFQVGKDVDAGVSAQKPAVADSDVVTIAQPFHAELPGSDSGTVPERGQHAEQVRATVNADEGPHTPVDGDTGRGDIDYQPAATEPGASPGVAPLIETLALSSPGAHDNPFRADEQPQLSEDRTEAFDARQQQHAANETAHHEGPDEARPARAEALPLSALETCAVESGDPAGAAHDELPRTETVADVSGGGECGTGTQGDIRSQVRHMMDDSLPIASAMREAVTQFQKGAVTLTKWPHKGRKRKHGSDVHKYRWLRVGRTWRKRAK